jgi:hypothetical protein
VSKRWKGDRKDSDTLRDIGWEVHWNIYESKVSWVIFSLQESLVSGAEVRMNYLILAEGDWFWRISPHALIGEWSEKFHRTAETRRQIQKEGESG